MIKALWVSVICYQGHNTLFEINLDAFGCILNNWTETELTCFTHSMKLFANQSELDILPAGWLRSVYTYTSITINVTVKIEHCIIGDGDFDE